MTQETLRSSLISPRQVATGDPAGASLENVVTDPLASGCLCYVTSGPGAGLWELQKDSTLPTDGVTIVEPIAGPGRWLLVVPPGLQVNASYLQFGAEQSGPGTAVRYLTPGQGFGIAPTAPRYLRSIYDLRIDGLSIQHDTPSSSNVEITYEVYLNDTPTGVALTIPASSSGHVHISAVDIPIVLCPKDIRISVRVSKAGMINPQIQNIHCAIAVTTR